MPLAGGLAQIDPFGDLLTLNAERAQRPAEGLLARDTSLKRLQTRLKRSGLNRLGRARSRDPLRPPP
jgi:hypothetical protein